MIYSPWNVPLGKFNFSSAHWKMCHKLKSRERTRKREKEKESFTTLCVKTERVKYNLLRTAKIYSSVA